MAKKSMIVKANKKQKYKVREYNRCPLTGRPRGFIRKYGMSRNAFRKLASEGLIPGVKKLVGSEVKMVIDPISDMLTRIRNAVTKKHKNVLIPSSKFKVEIAKILQNEGFINSFQIIKNGTFPSIKIDLKYDSRKSPVIKKIKRISKPGLRVYVNKNEIPRISGGLGTSIISTSRGVMTGNKAREIGVGGEILCSIL